MTSPAQWRRIEAALDEILALPESQWTAACARIAGDDARLRDEIGSLLAWTGGDDAILDRALALPISVAQDADYSLCAGMRVGAYRIVAPIGRGGMGEVYRAKRADGQFEQQVALKLIQREAAAHIERFQSERQMLARLEHPGIARLHDGGLADDGRPYMVMELVDGQPILDWCREQRCDLAQRLALFMAICGAVAYAHRNLVVHRDLKPANVLVTRTGEVKLLDFGVAKLVGARREEQTQSAPLTPAYAAPEQLTRGAVTTATDVYALGMLLFELLSGGRPWRLAELPLLAGLEKVLREAPPTVSAVAEQQTRAPVAPASLRGDLDAIVSKALRKEPEHRYETVSAFQADIARCMNHEPVAARAGARFYVLGRFVRRHRLLIGGGAVIALVIVIGVTVVIRTANQVRAEARKEAAVKDFLISVFRSNSSENPDGATARNTTALQLLDQGARAIGGRLTEAPDVRAELVDTFADLYDQLEEFDRVAALERQRLKDLQVSDGGRPSAAKAQALAELGRALAMTGRYTEASTTLNDALRTMDDIGDNRSPSRVQALTTLGLVDYHVASLSDPAAGLHTAQALALLEQYNPDSPDRLTAMELSARIADRRHQFADAERGYRAFLALADSDRFKHDPVAVGSALDDLGGFMLREQRYSEAEPLLRRAVDVLDRAEGRDQMDAVEARAHLGQVLAAMNQPREAADLLHRALDSVERTQGADSPSATAPLRLDVAVFEWRRGRWNEAKALLARNVAILEAIDSPEPFHYSKTQSYYARLLFDQGSLAEADRALTASERVLGKVQDAGSEIHALNLALRADLAANNADYAAASRLYDEVLSRWGPSGHKLPEPYVMAAKGRTRMLLRTRGADAAVLASQQILDDILHLPDLQYHADAEASARADLGSALLLAHEPTQALTHLQRAFELRFRIDDPSSPELALVRHELAAADRAMGPMDHRVSR